MIEFLKNKKVIQCFVFVILILSADFLLHSYNKEIENISTQVILKIEKSNKTSIAVVDFLDLQGNVLELGRFLSEELSVSISSSEKGFEVIDRVHLGALLKEHKLSYSGLVNKNNAQKLGKIAGVDALITGTVTPFGDSIRVHTKILDINTAKVIGAVTANIPKTTAIEELLNKGVEISVNSSTGSPTSNDTTDCVKSVDSNGFKFKAVGCFKKGKDARCEIIFINNGGQDVKIDIWDTSALVDNLGNKYKSNIIIGEKSSFKSFSRTLPEIFPPKVPVKVILVAENVSIQATHLTAMIKTRQFKELIVLRNIRIKK